MLYEIKNYKPTEEFTFDLYGGEISSLPDDYVMDLLNILCSFTHGPIRITTNMARIPDYFYDNRVSVAVSYDGNSRQDHTLVKQNMYEFGQQKEFDILTLASRKLLKQSAAEFLIDLMPIDGIRSLEIKSYSKNQANQHNVSFLDYEEYVKRIIMAHADMDIPYVLGNVELLESVMTREHNAFSDDHVYITPNNKFAVLEFDENDNEYFLELNNFQEYLDWTEKEKYSVTLNGYCMSCEYYGNCLSEHLREVKDITKSCNGFKGLIDWYRELENN